ncbi:fucolectin-1 isoform X2 [Xenopus laevis]|nr:fucolectin-1 isoform X2 [Xenopus laevis]OCT75132.1 hypothetical protein XELAEV_18034122mg [Xenopus laevis]
MKLRLCWAVCALLGLAWGCMPTPRARNIAINGQATQKSTHNPDTPDKAIDGNRDSNYSKMSCSCTNEEDWPWWKLDLKRTYKISSVIVTNRNDSYPERLNGTQIQVGNSLDNNYEVCGTITNTSSNPIHICCNDRGGRYISLVIPRNKSTLTLCEVQVFGRLARKKTC